MNHPQPQSAPLLMLKSASYFHHSINDESPYSVPRMNGRTAGYVSKIPAKLSSPLMPLCNPAQSPAICVVHIDGSSAKGATPLTDVALPRLELPLLPSTNLSKPTLPDPIPEAHHPAWSPRRPVALPAFARSLSRLRHCHRGSREKSSSVSLPRPSRLSSDTAASTSIFDNLARKRP
ncbi:hypothetical protein EX30DRAFT_268792 [Ascodesmis nigricans]|uniref:Uncharacterized protein n=1 Tax=Ascodesmis nigricans TaxID=341454 RepID=A0A4S2MX76_9PEZI|nr:hypothetical protein EX30DRAFT_268792 [Ascodesmis nigricans]